MTEGRTRAQTLAAEADALVGVDPARALQVAGEAVELGRATGDALASSAGLRTQGLVYRQLGRLDEAITVLREAARVAEKGNAVLAASEARMSLTYVLFSRGWTEQALAENDASAAVLDRLPAAARPLPYTRTLMQRGLLHQQSAEPVQALACYAEALPVLRAHRDRVHEARLLNNRGVLYLYSGRLDEAEADFAAAREIYVELARPQWVADTDWNLGFVSVRRGDLPAALRRFDAGDTWYAEQGSLPPENLVHRGELLLAAGLRLEARGMAKEAVRRLAEENNSTQHAEALLLLAQTELADDRTAEAREAADEAVRLFTVQQRSGWRAVAQYVGLRADELAGGARTDDLRARALRVAGELKAIGWLAQELDVRLIAARAALQAGLVEEARTELTDAASARETGSLELRIRAWYAEALRCAADGDPLAAEQALRAGMRVLDERRDMLGATELRVHLAGHGRDLAELGVQLAMRAKSPGRLLEWTERWRARGATQRVRPPEDETLVAVLTEVRAVTAELETALLRGERAARLEERRVELEDRVRVLSRQADGGGHGGARGPGAAPPDVAELAALLGDRVLVELVRLPDRMVAVTIRDGVAALHELGTYERVRRNLQSLLFSLRRMATRQGDAAAQAATRSSLDRAAARLNEELLVPLADVLAGRPCVLVPPAELQAAPWPVLPALTARAVTVAPSAAVWAQAAADSRPDDGTVLLTAGPGLDGAAREITELAQAYGSRARVLTGPAATAEAALAGLDGAGAAHIAAHGRVRSDNPLFSALELADGPLTVYDLERLDRAPRLVLLPACQSGIGQVLAGDEVLGLTSALFALGTRTIVATVIPVPDEATRPLMLSMHDGLRRGLPPATALAEARAAADPDDPAQLATAAGFVCFGAG